MFSLCIAKCLHSTFHSTHLLRPMLFFLSMIRRGHAAVSFVVLALWTYVFACLFARSCSCISRGMWRIASSHQIRSLRMSKTLLLGVSLCTMNVAYCIFAQNTVAEGLPARGRPARILASFCFYYIRFVFHIIGFYLPVAALSLLAARLRAARHCLFVLHIFT